MEYLGIQPQKPKIAVFDFTGCEGCELQLVNNEKTLLDFLDAVEVKAWREASSITDEAYDVALVEGAITRDDEVSRIETIRSRARVLVALGSCACFGGVNMLKNDVDLSEANREVYGDKPKKTLPARAVCDVVTVDVMVPGCPVSKDEVESLVKHLAWGMPFRFPAYPVCLECKQRFTTCVFEKGRLCLGTITRAGCNAPCPAGGLGCWGCRGPSADANMDSFFDVAKQHGFSTREIRERLSFFGGFGEVNVP